MYVNRDLCIFSRPIQNTKLSVVGSGTQCIISFTFMIIMRTAHTVVKAGKKEYISLLSNLWQVQIIVPPITEITDK